MSARASALDCDSCPAVWRASAPSLAQMRADAAGYGWRTVPGEDRDTCPRCSGVAGRVAAPLREAWGKASALYAMAPDPPSVGVFRELRRCLREIAAAAGIQAPGEVP